MDKQSNILEHFRMLASKEDITYKEFARHLSIFFGIECSSQDLVKQDGILSCMEHIFMVCEKNNISKRQIAVYETKWEGTTNKRSRVVKGIAIFHCWGNEYEELQDGIGNYTVGIVEWPDGTITYHKPTDIRFLS